MFHPVAILNPLDGKKVNSTSVEYNSHSSYKTKTIVAQIIADILLKLCSMFGEIKILSTLTGGIIQAPAGNSDNSLGVS